MKNGLKHKSLKVVTKRKVWLKLLIAFFLVFPAIVLGQFSISGIVFDASLKIPLPLATVQVKNSFTSAATDNKGRFHFEHLNAGDYIINVSYIGYGLFTSKLFLTKDTVFEIFLTKKIFQQDEVVVQATQAGSHSAMPYTEMDKEEITENNFGQDIPYLLQLQPSVVVTSDAGTGIGYTGLRIRGTDASRINVTINGIPFNDPESQQSYWVDLPDLASSADNIQVQRGVGTSSNGAGAFGASINITSDKLSAEPFGEVNLSAGSFNTFKRNFIGGTGLINNKLAFEGRLSRITSDGYIDRASSDLNSYFLTGTYYGKNNFLRFNLISGKEKTFQAWNGVPESRINNDTQGMSDFIDRNSLDAEDAANLLNSGRTYNYFTYKNQTDNYRQDHYQVFYSHEINNKIDVNVAAHLTHGKGYYEEYIKDAGYSSYHLTQPIIGSDTIFTTNLVRRKWLDNNFYGTTFSMDYNSYKNIKIIVGGAWNQYDGLHYNQVTWAQYAGNISPDYEYYHDDALKTDFNVYSKVILAVTSKWSFFADVQYRNVNYRFHGFNTELNNIPQRDKLNFFNPKGGITFKPNNKQTYYVSLSVGNHEPSRDDYVNSSTASRPKPETLYDLESGYRFSNKNFTAGFNYYLMLYKNQLVLTGKINDVGEYSRTNIDNSTRDGVELDAAYRIFKNLEIKTSAAISRTNIKLFEEYIDDYDNGGQRVTEHKNADIAFSPKYIANGIISYQPIKNLSVDLIYQYVGSQYLDNTSDNSRKLNTYSICSLRFNYSINKDASKHALIELGLQVNNLLDEKYESNGYTYSYFYSGQTTTENFYFPQAGINFLVSVRVRF